MRILLIYAHPAEGSFSSHLRDVTLKALEQSGHQVQITDLYAENFPPLLSRQERTQLREYGRKYGRHLGTR